MGFYSCPIFIHGQPMPLRHTAAHASTVDEGREGACTPCLEDLFATCPRKALASKCGLQKHHIQGWVDACLNATCDLQIRACLHGWPLAMGSLTQSENLSAQAHYRHHYAPCRESHDTACDLYACSSLASEGANCPE